MFWSVIGHRCGRLCRGFVVAWLTIADSPGGPFAFKIDVAQIYVLVNIGWHRAAPVMIFRLWGRRHFGGHEEITGDAEARPTDDGPTMT